MGREGGHEQEGRDVKEGKKVKERRVGEEGLEAVRAALGLAEGTEVKQERSEVKTRKTDPVGATSRTESHRPNSGEKRAEFQSLAQTSIEPKESVATAGSAAAVVGRSCSLCKERFQTLKDLAAHIERVHKSGGGKVKGRSSPVVARKGLQEKSSNLWKMSSEEKLVKIKQDFEKRRKGSASDYSDKPSLGHLRNILPDIRATPVVLGGKQGEGGEVEL